MSHDHPDAVAGAQAVALGVWLARAGQERSAIRARIAGRFGYDLGQTVEEIRAWYRFDVSCKGTVPPAIVCALAATDYEDAVRRAISLGGDSDTLACITGSIAEPLYGLPEDIAAETRRRLDPELLAVVDRLYARLRERRPEDRSSASPRSAAGPATGRSEDPGNRTREAGDQVGSGFFEL